MIKSEFKHKLKLSELKALLKQSRNDAAEGCRQSQDGLPCPILQQYAEKIAMKSHPLSHNERNLMKIEPSDTIKYEK